MAKLGFVSFDEIVELIQKDLQSLDHNVLNWHALDRDHSDIYTIEELCNGVEEDEVPYEMLWYVLIYKNLSDDERDRIKDALAIDTSSINARFSYGVRTSTDVYKSKYVTNSYKIAFSDYVNASSMINSSRAVELSKHVFGSQNITDSNFVGNCSGISDSNFIENSENVSNSVFCASCENFKNGLFCAFIKNETDSYYIFNKKVTKEEFDKVKKNLYTIFSKIFVEGANVKERDIKAFKEYCMIIPGYDVALFEYLLQKVFDIWALELKE